MFSTLSSRIMLIIYITLIISIPVGAYLVSQRTTLKSGAQETKETTPKVTSSPSPQSRTKALQEQSERAVNNASTSPPHKTESESPVATSFGPTLSLKVGFEGRRENNQAGRLFIGIVEGVIGLNPKFLLSFTVDLPNSGTYDSLSLAGLNLGTRYSALLKGTSQIASASVFIMSPTVTNLNGGQAITLLSGDLNEDNAINTSDYSIVQKAIGSTSKSSNWNENADINKDGVINSIDLAILNKNFGKIGDSGSWTSPLPKSATPSGTLTPQGYWLWIPGY